MLLFHTNTHTHTHTSHTSSVALLGVSANDGGGAEVSEKDWRKEENMLVEEVEFEDDLCVGGEKSIPSMCGECLGLALCVLCVCVWCGVCVLWLAPLSSGDNMWVLCEEVEMYGEKGEP